ncbi:MAG: ABC transporter permease [Herpetosiphonaceae bacterium]|nr:MAG: ABC transporter permease [Herpetosiphonaceae bacterium]
MRLRTAIRMNTLRLYWEIAIRSFKRATIYRTAYVAGLLTNAFFAAVRCFVYIAIFDAAESIAGYSLREAISYTWITQALISINAGWISSEIMLTVRSGDVVTDLARPWSFYGYWLSRFLGERAFSLLTRGSLTYLLGVLYFQAHVPSAGEALAFAAALLLAMLVSFALTFMVNLTAFWLVDSTGVIMLANVVLGFFSGFLIPLAFFPPALESIARILPFQAITALPAEIFLGRIAGAALIPALLLQLLWALMLTALALLVLRAAVRKVIIQGG